VPLLIASGTFIERRRVEFLPGTVGSGEKVMDVGLKRDWPLEQSDTEAPADAKSRESRVNTRLILHIIRDQSLGHFTLYQVEIEGSGTLLN
jgi:hypothetical protein